MSTTPWRDFVKAHMKEVSDLPSRQRLSALSVMYKGGAKPKAEDLPKQEPTTYKKRAKKAQPEPEPEEEPDFIVSVKHNTKKKAAPVAPVAPVVPVVQPPVVAPVVAPVPEKKKRVKKPPVPVVVESESESESEEEMPPPAPPAKAPKPKKV
jgi:hypothetical protein